MPTDLAAAARILAHGLDDLRRHGFLLTDAHIPVDEDDARVRARKAACGLLGLDENRCNDPAVAELAGALLASARSLEGAYALQSEAALLDVFRQGDAWAQAAIMHAAEVIAAAVHAGAPEPPTATVFDIQTRRPR